MPSMNAVTLTWPEVEAALAEFPRAQQAAFAARAARRIGPCVLQLEPAYGSEAREWLAALDTVLDAVELFALGKPISRFGLDLAAEIARGTATATANMARLKGHSPLIEDAELAYAAAAFAADCARASDDRRAATFAMQAARAAVAGGPVPREQSDDLRFLGFGEPLDAVRPTGWDEAGRFPRLVVTAEGETP